MATLALLIVALFAAPFLFIGAASVAHALSEPLSRFARAADRVIVASALAYLFGLRRIGRALGRARFYAASWIATRLYRLRGLLIEGVIIARTSDWRACAVGAVVLIGLIGCMVGGAVEAAGMLAMVVPMAAQRDAIPLIWRQRVCQAATFTNRYGFRSPSVTPDATVNHLRQWLQWNDPNGDYYDDSERGPLMLQEAWQLIAEACEDDLRWIETRDTVDRIANSLLSTQLRLSETVAPLGVTDTLDELENARDAQIMVIGRLRAHFDRDALAIGYHERDHVALNVLATCRSAVDCGRALALAIDCAKDDDDLNVRFF